MKHLMNGGLPTKLGFYLIYDKEDRQFLCKYFDPVEGKFDGCPPSKDRFLWMSAHADIHALQNKVSTQEDIKQYLEAQGYFYVQDVLHNHETSGCWMDQKPVRKNLMKP